MKVSQLRLEDVSFSDCRLRNINLYIDRSFFQIDMGELYYNKTQAYVNDVRFFGWGWKQIRITAYGPESDSAQEVHALDELREIEWSVVEGESITFGGFAVDSDTWIELTFTDLHYCFIPLDQPG